MYDEQMHGSYKPNRLPAVAIGMRIKPAQRQGVIKNKLCRLETQAVIFLVEFVLFIAPNPVHTALPVDVTTKA